MCGALSWVSDPRLPGWVGVREPRGRLGGDDTAYAKTLQSVPHFRVHHSPHSTSPQALAREISAPTRWKGEGEKGAYGKIGAYVWD